MAGSKDNIVELGKNTQFPHNDPTKGGRKPSIKKQLKLLALSDGAIKFPPEQVKTIHKDGSVTLIIPTEIQLAMKLVSIAMSGKNNTTLNAIKTIMEHFDGKPVQPIENVNETMSMDEKLRKLEELEAIAKDEKKGK